MEDKLKQIIDASADQADKIQARINTFIERVKEFYYKVDNEWLDGCYNEVFTTDLSSMTITEESLGTYEVNKKNLRIGSYFLEFEPIGTVLIGSDARIDLKYLNESVKFVRVGNNFENFRDLIEIRVNGRIEKERKEPGEIVWKFVNPQNSKLIKVTSTSLQNLIADLINAKN